MQMDMVFADNTFQNLNIQRIASLADELSTTQLHFTLQYMIAILSDPYQVHL